MVAFSGSAVQVMDDLAGQQSPLELGVRVFYGLAMTPPLYVYLWAVRNPVIIVGASTGVVYANQTDGVATVHRDLEGFLVPLPPIQARVFDPDWWCRNHNHRFPGDSSAWTAIEREIEAAVASIVSSGEVPRNLRVIPHPDNAEGWVHVAFTFPDLGPEAEGTATRELTGILTWENCD